MRERIRELARILVPRYPRWINDNVTLSIADLQHRYPADGQLKEMLSLVLPDYRLGDLIDDARSK
jgi:hypothetical protein